MTSEGAGLVALRLRWGRAVRMAGPVTAAARLARLLSLGLMLTGGVVAWPALATGAVPSAAPSAAARIEADPAPRVRAALPARSTDVGARCEADLSDHWALYQRIAARRQPESRAMTEERNAHAD